MADLTIKTAPWGGSGGVERNPGAVVASTTLKQITILHGEDGVQSLEFACEVNGALKNFGPWGSSRGQPSESQVNFELGEDLTAINGTHGPLGGSEVVTSLAFKTGRHTYGPFGPVSGTPFSLSLLNGKVVCFHARSGEMLDAVGVYLAPETML